MDTSRKIRFIFLGNGGVDYYREKFVDSSNIMFCDDVLATGGLTYKAYKNFIENESTNTKYLNIIVFLFFQHQFPFKDFTTSAKFSFNLFASPMISLVTKNKPIQNPTQQPFDEFQ